MSSSRAKRTRAVSHSDQHAAAHTAVLAAWTSGVAACLLGMLAPDSSTMRTPSLFAAFALLCACSSSSSAPSTGSGCASSADCGGGLCVVSQDFVGGYCTKGCSLADPSSCPAGSVCIDDASGVPADAGISAVCYQSCRTSADCTRPGYACLEKANHMVCRNGT